MFDFDDLTAAELFVFTIFALSVVAAFLSIVQSTKSTYRPSDRQSCASVYVRSLYVYPVKGCAGVSVNQCSIDRLGFVNDRRFIIIRGSASQLANQTIDLTSDQLDEQSIKQVVHSLNPSINQLPTMISQRQQPKLALIQPSLQSQQYLTLSYPGKSSINVPIKPSEKCRILPIKLWSQVVLTSLYDSDLASNRSINAWLSDIIGEPASLCTLIEGDIEKQYRPLDPDYDIDRPNNQALNQPTNQTTFSDGYPFLLASEASLRDLNQMITETNNGSLKPIEMRAFRPNIIIDSHNESLKPWIEDQWRSFRVINQSNSDSLLFTCAKPCDRCQVPTIDQSTGEFNEKIDESTGQPVRSNEPTETMRKTRNLQAVLRYIKKANNQPSSLSLVQRLRNLLARADHQSDDESRVYFGQNCICHPSNQSHDNVVRVGDRVEVTEWKPAGVFVEKTVDRH